MSSVIVRELSIGEGSPKICIPIAENNLENIIKAAEQILDSPADLVEWRADWFEYLLDFDKTKDVLLTYYEYLRRFLIILYKVFYVTKNHILHFSCKCLFYLIIRSQ